jgi:hypothetical protein
MSHTALIILKCSVEGVLKLLWKQWDTVNLSGTVKCLDEVSTVLSSTAIEQDIRIVEL